MGCGAGEAGVATGEAASHQEKARMAVSYEKFQQVAMALGAHLRQREEAAEAGEHLALLD